ncbi:MAG: sigma-54 dependent transcriptional regulator [Proteobacteria bacterium]|jgi:two-component system, NtrC family, response regulator HydG|nr:sigma-54 dependent transcriptional regulator [Pseudomonadota bacterium]MDA1300308.1 sigma-54 dependent transcriptional regulator [Pseudomonadota bacterium]
MSQKHILIVEDEILIRSSIKKFLEKNNYRVCEAGSVDEAVKFDLDRFSLIITDLRLPGSSGTDVIKIAPEVPVLVMTSYASLESAVECMKMGAVDYIAKPFDYDHLLASVHQLTSGTSDARAATNDMIGTSEAMQKLFIRVDKVAPTDTNVLIVGESGTGKELVARAIHRRSQQASRNMISVNCAAIPDTLIESELFGHEKGAFTGASSSRVGLVEAANGSTLFLDEIGELPLDAQARLLRVIQEGEVRRVGSVETRQVQVRLIAATHRDLKALTETGGFREDLYYRLNVVKLSLPPLRERGDDLMALANHFLRHMATKFGKRRLRFSDETLTLLKRYHWPGNIRELENAIERAIILCEGNTITPDLLAVDPKVATAPSAEYRSINEDDLSIEDYILKFIQENEEHMTETELAQKLGISRKSLWQKRQRLNIPRERSRRKD